MELSIKNAPLVKWIVRLAPPLVSFALVVALATPKTVPLVPDSAQYLAMAAGRWSQVSAPFGYRVLVPYTARLCAALLHTSLDRAFYSIAVIDLAIFLIAISSLVQDTLIAAVSLPLLVASPMGFALFQDYYLPDLTHATFLALLLVALRHKQLLIAALLLVVLMVVRESTLMVAAVIILLAAWRKEFAWLWLTVGATTVGYSLSKVLVPVHLTNVHHMPALEYLMFKVPFNAIRHLAGFALVPNTLRGQPGYTCECRWVFHMPVFLGRITEFGVCPFNVVYPAGTAVVMMSLFGVCPIVLIALVRSGCVKPRELWFEFAFMYGLTAFLIAPLLGAAIVRLGGYGWPAFWVVMPAIAAKANWSRRQIGGLVIAQILACWIPALVTGSFNLEMSEQFPFGTVLVALLACYMFAKYVSEPSKKLEVERCVSPSA